MTRTGPPRADVWPPAVSESAYLARYDEVQHAWVRLGEPLTVSAKRVDTLLPGAGTYALVLPDDGVAMPDAGGALVGVPMQEVPQGCAAAGTLVPAKALLTGQIVQGRLALYCPDPLPSGIVLQGKVNENYRWLNGEVVAKRSRKLTLSCKEPRGLAKCWWRGRLA